MVQTYAAPQHGVTSAAAKLLLAANGDPQHVLLALSAILDTTKRIRQALDGLDVHDHRDREKR